jgi:hypothetical protein
LKDVLHLFERTYSPFFRPQAAEWLHKKRRSYMKKKSALLLTPPPPIVWLNGSPGLPP